MVPNKVIGWNVNTAVSWAVYRSKTSSTIRSMGWDVEGAVHWAVYRAVFWAVSGAVRNDPPHPSLVEFLSAGGKAAS